MNPPSEGHLFELYGRVHKPGMTAKQVTDEIKKLYPSWFESNPNAQWAMEALLEQIVPEWCHWIGGRFYEEGRLREPGPEDEPGAEDL
jgi:hypothetical protein